MVNGRSLNGNAEKTQMRNFKRPLALALAACQIILGLTSAVPGPVMAQAIDSEPPQVTFDRLGEGVRDDTQVVSATVTDNVAVESVVLHYRFDNEASYRTIPMSRLASTDIYSASVEPSSGDELMLYYLETRDSSGNRTLEGFSFDPIERVLVAANVVATTADAPSGTAISTRSKILYGVLGLVVVGALAAAAGGSSGGGGGGDGNVPVTVITDPLVAQ